MSSDMVLVIKLMTVPISDFQNTIGTHREEIVNTKVDIYEELGPQIYTNTSARIRE